MRQARGDNRGRDGHEQARRDGGDAVADRALDHPQDRCGDAGERGNGRGQTHEPTVRARDPDRGHERRGLKPDDHHAGEVGVGRRLLHHEGQHHEHEDDPVAVAHASPVRSLATMSSLSTPPTTAPATITSEYVSSQPCSENAIPIRP